LNAGASVAMVEVGVDAATDVTGFGLVGHLLEMLTGAVSARLDFAAIPVIHDALSLAEQGFVPGGTKRNHESMRAAVEAHGLAPEEEMLLFDAQTSGGLLIAVDPGKTSRLLGALEANGVPGASKIGSIVEGSGRIEVG
jgi:selenide,water dikinase